MPAAKDTTPDSGTETPAEPTDQPQSSAPDASSESSASTTPSDTTSSTEPGEGSENATDANSDADATEQPDSQPEQPEPQADDVDPTATGSAPEDEPGSDGSSDPEPEAVVVEEDIVVITVVECVAAGCLNGAITTLGWRTQSDVNLDLPVCGPHQDALVGDTMYFDPTF